MGAASAFDKINEDMLSEYLFLNPGKATMLGLHEPYDYQMSHGGPEHINKNLAFLEQWKDAAHKVARRGRLNLDQTLSLEALDMAVDRARFFTKDYPIWRMNPDCLSSMGPMLLHMATSDYAPIAKRLDGVSWRLSRLPQYLSEFRTRFDKHHPVELWTDDAITACERFPKFVDVIEKAARERIPDRFLTQLKRSKSIAGDALDQHLEWLRDIRRDSIAEFAMGTARFEKLLRLRKIGMNKAQMLKFGEDGYRSWLEEREKMARRLTPKGDFHSAARLLETHSPRSFEEVLKAAEAEAQSARSFVEIGGFATVPPKGIFTASETPDFMAPLLPYGNLYMASKFDRGLYATYYFTRPKTRAELRSYYCHSSIVTMMGHSAYPGHFLQRCVAKERPWMFMLPEFAGSDIVTYGWSFDAAEAWACSASALMYDKGYKPNDEVYFQIIVARLMQYLGAMIDVKLCCGETTIDEYVDEYSEATGLPRAGAVSEIKWMAREPGTFLSFATGVHRFKELRTEVSRAVGKSFDERRFNDEFMGHADLPMALARKGVLANMTGRAGAPKRIKQG